MAAARLLWYSLMVAALFSLGWAGISGSWREALSGLTASSQARGLACRVSVALAPLVPLWQVRVAGMRSAES